MLKKSFYAFVIIVLTGCTTTEQLVQSGALKKGMSKSEFYGVPLVSNFVGEFNDNPFNNGCSKFYDKSSRFEILEPSSSRIFYVFRDVYQSGKDCWVTGDGYLAGIFYSRGKAQAFVQENTVKLQVAKTEKKQNKEIQKQPEPVKPDDLFFSEYAEGVTASHENRYLEIFNPTNKDILLDNYAYLGDIYSRRDYWHHFPKGAIIRANDFYIICSVNAAPEIMSKCNYASSAFVYFDGPEPIRLVRGAKSGYDVLDTIGVGGIAPKLGFKVCGDGSTNNSVLIKKPSRIGNPNWYKSRGTSASDCDWIVKMNKNHGKSAYDGDWSGLGKHEFNGQTYLASKQSPIMADKKPPLIANKKPSSTKAKTDEDKIRKIANGSGFFVNPEGYLVSNYHVIEICESVKTLIDGNVYDVNIIATDNVNDLMIGRIDDLSGNNYLFINTKGAYLGDNVLAAGFPLADSLSDQIKVTRGIVSSMSGPGNNYSQYQIDAAVQGGNSGGPLLDDSGNVVGVVVAQLNKYKFLTSAKTIPENVNFAIKSQNVELFLDANQIAYSSKNSTYQVENRQIAQSAEKATVNLSCYNSIANLKEKYGEQKVSNIFSSENLPD